jgi:hypothetical protein
MRGGGTTRCIGSSGAEEAQSTPNDIVSRIGNPINEWLIILRSPRWRKSGNTEKNATNAIAIILFSLTNSSRGRDRISATAK